jgi:putative inorganic carbon (hco3(-)) transporter
MRDLAVAAIVFGLLPLCLLRPYIGVLLWTWLSLMNPHKLAWGFAFDFPFAYIVAIATLIGLVISRDPKRLPITPVTVAMAALIGWMCVTSFFALYPEQIGAPFTQAIKIQLMIFVTLMVLHYRRNLELLIWVSVASIAFYGIKGGIFTLTTGGGSIVYGPPGGFFFENNALAVTLIMIIPLMFYMYQHAGDVHRYAGTRIFKWGLVVGAMLCAVAALGSHSRGGLLAIGAMFAFLWWRSRHKLLLLIPIAMVGIVALTYMPDAWWQRMTSIADYEGDTSAMGRINAWGWRGTSRSTVSPAAVSMWSRRNCSTGIRLTRPTERVLRTASTFRFSASTVLSVLASSCLFGQRCGAPRTSCGERRRAVRRLCGPWISQQWFR